MGLKAAIIKLMCLRSEIKGTFSSLGQIFEGKKPVNRELLQCQERAEAFLIYAIIVGCALLALLCLFCYMCYCKSTTVKSYVNVILPRAPVQRIRNGQGLKKQNNY